MSRLQVRIASEGKHVARLRQRRLTQSVTHTYSIRKPSPTHNRPLVYWTYFSRLARGSGRTLTGPRVYVWALRPRLSVEVCVFNTPCPPDWFTETRAVRPVHLRVTYHWTPGSPAERMIYNAYACRGLTYGIFRHLTAAVLQQWWRRIRNDRRHRLR